MKEHRFILSFFIFLFIGMVLAYSFWFTFLPSDMVNTAFESQIETIMSITGRDVTATGAATTDSPLVSILSNNFRVWAFCILFSFLYGAGAIFILTWNASVIGTAIGDLLRTTIVKYAEASRISLIYNYFMAIPVGFSYLVHGIPEIMGYFLGALAGGVISVAVVRHDYRTREFRKIVIDSLDLIILSAIVVVLAGVVEVYLTPYLV
jgi:uncharacterized membrane protein SpoIIM required for sporulation